ncbi:MAG: hypothetical protein ACREJ3_10365, partial [Polyangiaceae bacterium]
MTIAKARYRGRAASGARALALGMAGLGAIATSGCSSSGSAPASHGDAGATSPGVATALASLGAGAWSTALAQCLSAEATSPNACDAKYCELIARSMQVVGEINTFLLPRYRRPLNPEPGDAANLMQTNTLLAAATTSAEAVTAGQCELDLPKLPVLIGDAADPILLGEARGRWTTRDAHLLAALFYSIRYGLQAEFNPQP